MPNTWFIMSIRGSITTIFTFKLSFVRKAHLISSLATSAVEADWMISASSRCFRIFAWLVSFTLVFPIFHAYIVLQGLKEIHDAGFMHLDMKPANILITFEGALKIGDFGLAQPVTTSEGVDVEGDREYMA